MDQKSLQIRRSQWERIVLEGNQASISKKEWCRQHGISEKSFYYWQRKIRLQAIDAMETAQTASVPSTATSSFVELPIPSAQPSFKETPPAPGLSPELMLQVGDCRIYVTGAV